MAISDDTQYGVTPQGFVRMRLPEIQKNLFSRLDAKLGTTVSRKPNSVIGVLVGLIAEESDRHWALEEADYYARSPITADDGSIDNTLAYTQVVRKTAERTYLYAVCYGRSGMVLPANCQIKGRDGNKFNISAESTISLNNCVHVTLTASNVVAGNIYTIELDNDSTASYTALEGDSSATVYTNIMQQIANDDWSISVSDGNLILERTSRRYGGTVTPSETFSVVQVGTPIRFNCDEYGAIEPDLKSVTTINTNYDGWYSVSNESDCYVGRDAETATEVRQRYAAAVYRKSIGMKESIKAALMELQDVQAVSIFENRSDETVDGLKPHSFEAIVFGGDDEEIAQTLVNTAPLGIDTNGNVGVKVDDDNGSTMDVYFSRPEDVPIYVKVLVHEYEEETLPGNMVDKIKEIVLSEMSNLNMGNDVIYQRLIGPIYKGVDGIGYMDITISTSADSLSAQNIAISRRQIATIKAENISVGLEL